MALDELSEDVGADHRHEERVFVVDSSEVVLDCRQLVQVDHAVLILFALEYSEDEAVGGLNRGLDCVDYFVDLALLDVVSGLEVGVGEYVADQALDVLLGGLLGNHDWRWHVAESERPSQ